MALLPNLKRLLIPRKGSNQVSDLDINWRAIETWANALSQGGIQELTSMDGSVTITDPFGPITDLSATGGGGTHYASLIGVGQTVTPGALSQSGAFSVILGASGTALSSGLAVQLLDHSTAGYGITVSSTNGTVNVSGNVAIISGTLGAEVFSHGSAGVVIAALGDRLNFFGQTGGPAGRPTVTGSRSGNAALASLLTALASMNLIGDGSTP